MLLPRVGYLQQGTQCIWFKYSGGGTHFHYLVELMPFNLIDQGVNQCNVILYK